jgi:hypothetical protein
MGCGCGRNKVNQSRTARPHRTTPKLTDGSRRRTNQSNAKIAAKALFEGGISAATHRQRKRIENLRREAIRSKFGK